MERDSIYNYYAAEVLEDATDWMEEYLTEDTAIQEYEEVYDEMWAVDEVTGNGSSAGHPHLYAEMAQAAVFDPNIMEEVEGAFGKLEAERFVGKGYEGLVYIDASVRCWMLGELGDRLEKLWDLMRKEYLDEEVED